MTTLAHASRRPSQAHPGPTSLALKAFMVVVVAHWAEHLTQAFQI